MGEHGTPKGFGQHVRAGETPCAACRAAVPRTAGLARDASARARRLAAVEQAWRDGLKAQERAVLDAHFAGELTLG